MKRFHANRAPLSAVAVLAAVGGTAAAAGQTARPGPTRSGEDIAAQCLACHTLGPDEPNRIGPNLHGIFGAKAGSRSDYAYSDAMKASGIVWSDMTLEALVAAPAKLVPGTKMAFAGLGDAADRRAVIDYLRSETAVR